MAQGFTRFRKLQVGIQSVIGTAVPATRVLPYRSIIVYNPNREDPDVDVGSLDPILKPFDAAPEVTLPGATGPLAFNDAVVRYSAGLKGGVSPTGNALSGYTWTFQVASLTADTFDYYSVQTGDDTAVSAGSGELGFGGVINQLSETMDESLAPWQVSDDWILAGATFGNVTAALTVDSTPEWVYGADTAVYLNSVAGAIGATQLLAAVRGIEVTVNNNLDQKRFADGSNARFQLQGFGRGPREITVALTVEKTTATIAEAATIDDTPVPDRYIKIATNSTELAGTTNTHYRELYIPCRLFEVSEGEIENNANYTLTYRAFYDPTLTYAFKAIVRNSLATLP
jgi:hypothetical protein